MINATQAMHGNKQTQTTQLKLLENRLKSYLKMNIGIYALTQLQVALYCTAATTGIQKYRTEHTIRENTRRTHVSFILHN